jgi:hypothetical protein
VGKSKKLKCGQFRIHCGDADFRFSHGEIVDESEVRRIVEVYLKKWQPELLPGLVLENYRGELLKLQLRVDFTETMRRK